MSVLFIVGYLVGSVPFGLILARLFGYGDIRKIGSGNIGATNVLRTGNKALAAATLILDAGKGAIPIFLLAFFVIQDTPDPAVSEDFYNVMALSFGFGAILGHCFPVWLKFKGGKGVATTLGVLLVATPWAGFVAVCTWGIVAGFFRISSLAALCAVAIAPLAAFLIYGPMPGIITILIALLVFWRHKGNIDRLLKGEEPKIGAGKTQA
ncbi:MAG: glycerol-3-phosphate 1-O-acyltransferase PlsY [Alphaproteobacteria bacterium]|nr:glycerol-3-phosphate 1-O-acyltransferase PlsY [Alphaproteobacteria bacterium]